MTQAVHPGSYSRHNPRNQIVTWGPLLPNAPGNPQLCHGTPRFAAQGPGPLIANTEVTGDVGLY